MDDYRTKTNLILPFKGELKVTNGGRDLETNNHVKIGGSVTFAYDFRNEHTGDGKLLKDYEAFGREVIAPGAGVISQVINGSIDCLPGERDRGVAWGNTVIIDHQNGEWSLLCHMQHNSIKINARNTIKQGDFIGLCGNTGNTSEPHIHFHLQDHGLAYKANPLPAQFARIMVNGQEKTNYEPVRGEKVKNF